MKLLSIVFCAFLFSFPVFAQMGILTTDSKLYDLKKEGKYDEAIADLNERINAQPKNGELYLRRAEFLKLQNKLDEAIADISRGIKIEPNNPTFYVARAEYYNLAKNNDAVLRDIQTALSLDPNSPGKLRIVARELAFGEQYEEIIKIADEYIARNSPNSDLNFQAYRVRSESNFALKEYDSALEDSIKAINFIVFTGDVSKDFLARIELYNMSESKVILQITQNYLKDDERIFDYYKQLFDALEKKTEVATAQRFQELVEVFKSARPNKLIDADSMDYFNVGELERMMISCAELYAEKGQPEKGIEVFNRFVNLKLSKKWWRHFQRADFYLKLKKNQEALDDLTVGLSEGEKVSQRYPQYILYLIKRGRLYESAKQFDKAIKDYEMVKIISPRNEESMNNMIISARQKMTENNN